MPEMDQSIQRAPRGWPLVAEELQHLVDEEPRRRRLEIEDRAIAAPGPRSGVLDDAGLERIAEDVRDRRDQMRGAREFLGARAIPEEVVGTAVAPVGPPRVVAIELLEALGESVLGRSKD